MANSKESDFLRNLYQDWTDRMVADPNLSIANPFSAPKAISPSDLPSKVRCASSTRSRKSLSQLSISTMRQRPAKALAKPGTLPISQPSLSPADAIRKPARNASQKTHLQLAGQSAAAFVKKYLVGNANKEIKRRAVA